MGFVFDVWCKLQELQRGTTTMQIVSLFLQANTANVNVGPSLTHFGPD